MVLEELIALLGFEVEGEENLRRFQSNLDGAKRRLDSFAKGAAEVGRKVALGMAAIGTAAVAAGTAMFKLANDAAAELDPLIKAADRVGMSFDALQEWGHAATQSGASTSELASSAQQLQQRLAEAGRGMGRAKTALEAYGMSATDAQGNVKSVDTVLSELAEKFQTLDEAQSLDLGAKLGLSPGMITMLRSGNAEIEKLRQEARDLGLVFSEEEARNAEKYNDQVDRMGRAFKALGFAIGVEAMPFLMDWMDGLESWWKLNAQIVRQNLGKTVDALGHAIGRIAQTSTRMVGALLNTFERLGNAVSGVLRTLSGGTIDLSGWQGFAAALGAILMRIFPVWAGLVLAFLALDDFLAWMEDGESVIGTFVESLPALVDAIDEVIPGFKDAAEAAAQAFRDGDWLGVGKAAADAIVAGLASLGAALGTAIADAFTAAGPMIEAAVAGMVAGAVAAVLSVNLTAAGEAAARSFRDGFASVKGYIEATFGDINSEEIGRKIGQGIVDGIVGLATAQLRGWGYLFGNVIGEVQTIGRGLLAMIQMQIDFWVSTVTGAFDQILTALQGIVDLAEFQIGFWRDSTHEAMDLVVGIVRGMAGQIHELIREWFNIDLTDIGIRLMTSLWEGMKTLGGAIRDWFMSLFTLPDFSFAPAGGSAPSSSQQAGSAIGGMADPARIAEIAERLGQVTGDRAIEQTVNTVANDNRSHTNNIDISAPVTVTATTNASPAQIGAAAGSGVRNAAREATRSLAVTGNSGGAGR